MKEGDSYTQPAPECTCSWSVTANIGPTVRTLVHKCANCKKADGEPEYSGDPDEETLTIGGASPISLTTDSFGNLDIMMWNAPITITKEE